MLSKEMDEFVHELHLDGMYVLPCGGGAINEPVRAIRKLEPKYGKAGLVRLSMELAFEMPDEDIHPLETVSVALGILYHLADNALLEKLITMREEWMGTGGDAAHEESDKPMWRIEPLISGLCNRLNHPYPDGIEPLHPLEEHARFLDHRGGD